MSKPLFRYTVGSCLQQGLDILVESINKTTKALGIETFDWIICYNGLTKENVAFLKNVIGDRPINLFGQNWIDCPVDDRCQSPLRSDGSYEWNGNRCGGTMWKVCPARMRMETHEIVMDNDIVIVKPLSQIIEFLASTDKALILEEPIRFYGRYDNLFPGTKQDGPFLNSGLMGFPPGYDYNNAIRKTWEENGRYGNISQADEQGLLTYTLNQLPSIRIKANHVIEILARDFRSKITGYEQAYHFTQANRIPMHRGWVDYQKMTSKQIVL